MSQKHIATHTENVITHNVGTSFIMKNENIGKRESIMRNQARYK